jgi:hypothetical protein
MKVIKKYIQDMAILYQGLRYLDVNIYTPWKLHKLLTLNSLTMSGRICSRVLDQALQCRLICSSVSSSLLHAMHRLCVSVIVVYSSLWAFSTLPKETKVVTFTIWLLLIFSIFF